MPKLVDHSERRQRIIEAAWRLIAERGIDAATMREIAREAGYANGALTHYFADKEALLRAAYEHVYSATNGRVAVAVSGLDGVEALRAFCREVLPLDDLQLEEARMVLSVWSRAIVDEALEAVHAESMGVWRSMIVEWLREGRDLGQVRTSTTDDVLADQLMTQLMGAQVMALAGGSAVGPAAQEAVLEEWISRLARP
ncbi:TetR/AcrR family transcriptional regulator [Kineococcus sp. SYSU DK018]|uniref:TetR/AcrR family transcriptional regulator n=1 Tax=Kineococcus sp. SYSU DK018 TaxID=3383139 RepID=UPI003D7F004B